MPNRLPFTGSPKGREPSFKSQSLVLDTVRLVETWIERAHQRRALRSLPEHLMRDMAHIVGLGRYHGNAAGLRHFWRHAGHIEVANEDMPTFGDEGQRHSYGAP